MSYLSSVSLEINRPILVFGSDGQVGRSLQNYLKMLRLPKVFLNRNDCDISNEVLLLEMLNRYQPQIVINAAAYTAVDKAESEKDLAFAINARAPQVMANYVANCARGILLHYSTDYVFEGSKQTEHSETDVTGPINQLCIYGQSKLAGEKSIEEVFNRVRASDRDNYGGKLHRYYILRTSWVYGDGNNFIKNMLFYAKERNQIEVVADQVGVPTSASWLAEIGICMFSSKVRSGIYHAVPDGKTSWHGLALHAITVANEMGIVIKANLNNILPIPARDYVSPAKRPYNSSMCNHKLKKALFDTPLIETYPNWQEQVKAYIKNYVNNTPVI